MKIAVCVKQVPDSWAEKKMVNGILDRENVDAVLNDLDEYAVEEALRIAEAHGGNEEGGPHTVTVISMGPERATEAVRKALSMGANDAILVTDAKLAGADALATSAVLAAVIEKGGFDLVICGTESTDARMSVVPAMLAERLNVAQLTFASKVEVDPAAQKVAITRVTEAGVDEMNAAFPCVISVVEKINEPRYPSFKGIMAAKKKVIDSRDLAAVGVAVESAWSLVADSSPRPPRAAGIKVTDDNISWELSANYRLTDKTSLFARVADGFRAQSIQGRDVAFEAPPSVADSETIMSYEIGAKSDLLDNTLRLNGAVFYYVIDDIQLSAIGGETQGNQLINADKGVGYGFEFDFDYRVLANLSVGGGFSYNKTELQDDNLTVAPCGSGLCTVLDPRNAQNLALIDGNPFPQAPETILTLNARYDFPIDSGEIYVYGDYQLQGKTNLFLYESAEFKSNNNYEAGLRVAYINYENNYEVGVFGRNITDEDNLKGAIDFSNLTGFVNEPRTFGVDFKISFY